MKIYNRREFLKLPDGSTVYHEGKPWFFGDIEIKQETWTNTNDWLYQYFGSVAADSRTDEDESDLLDDMRSTGASYPLDTSWDRNGMYDEDSLFLVYEPEDLDVLIKALSEARGEVIEDNNNARR